ncbi:MAG: hypothetical protein R2788_01860 [Saprospiraceae bacterium]
MKRGLNTALDRMRTEDIWKVNIRHSPAEKPSSEPSGFSDLPFGKRRLPFGQLLRMKQSNPNFCNIILLNPLKNVDGLIHLATTFLEAV